MGFMFGERRHNAAELQDAEEAVAAGIAAIGGKAQPAFHKDERAVFDAFAGNMLEIEISATGTVREAFEYGSDSPGVKSPLAAVASPRAQASRSEHEVENSVSVRTKTIVTATLGTDHRHSESVAQDTEKSVGEQDAEIRSAQEAAISRISCGSCIPGERGVAPRTIGDGQPGVTRR